MARRRDALKTVAEEAPQVLAKRPKPKPKRNRSWDAKRSKATYDLPPEMIARVREIAKELGEEHPNARVRISDVARLLLEAGLESYEAGDLEIQLVPSELRLFSD